MRFVFGLLKSKNHAKFRTFRPVKPLTSELYQFFSVITKKYFHLTLF